MIGVDEIAGRLPHRHPILLVDRVTEIVPGERLTALKAVTATEPWFRGLLGDGTPGPYFPDVLLIESWCQAAGVLATWDKPNPDVLSGDVMLFGSLNDVRFLRRVEAGTLVEHRVRLIRNLGDTLVFAGSSTVDGESVLDVGQVLMAMRPAEVLRPSAQLSERSTP